MILTKEAMERIIFLNNRKVKGFSLIELIAAIAIFSIAIIAISLAFSLSINTWKKGNTKLSSVSYSQAIAEHFKGSGKSALKRITSTPDSTDGVSCYIYFDDKLENLILYFQDGTVTYFNNGGRDFYTWANVASPTLRGKVSSDDNTNIDSSLYTNCKNINISKALNKKYGGYLMVKKDTPIESDMYYLKVKTWNLQGENMENSGSTMEVYLGR